MLRPSQAAHDAYDGMSRTGGTQQFSPLARPAAMKVGCGADNNGTAAAYDLYTGVYTSIDVHLFHLFCSLKVRTSIDDVGRVRQDVKEPM